MVIVTGDRDSFQLVQDPYIRVLYNKRGVSDYALYDEAGIAERTGVTPEKYVLLASLRGDPSDNLPGIPGVGEKTAAKLINKYGDLDGVFGHVAEQTPKLRQNLEENEHLARSNARLIPLVRDVPLDVDASRLELGGWDPARAEATFEEYEMKTVWQRLVELLDAGALGEPLGRERAAHPGWTRRPPVTPSPHPGRSRCATSPSRPSATEAAKELGELGKGQLAVAGRWNGLPGRSDLVAVLVLATEGDEAGLGVLLPSDQLDDEAVVTKLNALLAQPVLGHNVKELMRSLLPLGIDVNGLEMDTAVAAYLLDASTGEYQLQQLREQTGQLSLEIVEAGETAADLAKDAAGEAADVFAMAHSFRTRLTADDMVELHDDIERPLVRVLAKMEVAGIAVDRNELQSIADELKASAATLQDEVQKIAGHEFNVNSTPQLRTVLFDELGLTPGKKTKTGYSTDAQTLEKMRDEHPIIETLLTTARSRSCARPTARACSPRCRTTGASTRRSARPWRAPGASRRTGRTSTTSPCAAISANSSARPSCRPRGTFLVADYDQVELR